MRLVIALSILFVFSLSACTVGSLPDGQYACSDNADCIFPDVCHNGYCGQTPNDPSITCVDDDGDGYGSNQDPLERGDCPQCSQFGRCGFDCNDADDSINPGAVESCNGVDEDCDGSPDNPSTCESAADCTGMDTPENSLAPLCVNSSGDPCTTEDSCTCEIKMSNQFCPGGSSEVQQCVGGAYANTPFPGPC